MTREEYWQAVSAELKNLLDGEKKSVRRELDGHIEDCMEALSARDYTPQEAEARAVAVMGDPAETGRAINAQYSMFWLYFGWIAAVGVAILCIFFISEIASCLDRFRMLDDAYFNSFYASRPYSDDARAAMLFVPVEQEMAVGSDRIVCKQAGIYAFDGSDGETGYAVILRFLHRDRFPWGRTISGLHSFVQINSADYTEQDYPGYGRTGIDCSIGWLTYFTRVCRVEPGETVVCVSCDYLNYHGEMEIPLSWEGVPE